VEGDAKADVDVDEPVNIKPGKKLSWGGENDSSR